MRTVCCTVLENGNQITDSRVSNDSQGGGMRDSRSGVSGWLMHVASKLLNWVTGTRDAVIPFFNHYNDVLFNHLKFPSVSGFKIS